MPARTNKRVIYAQRAVAISANGAAINTTYDIAKGVQEVGVSTNFRNNPYFQMGQLAIYEDVEELPDVEVTMSKLLDGRSLLYHLATSAGGTTSPTLIGRQNAKCVFTMGVYPDTNDYATGSPPSIVQCSGLFPSSVQYSFPIDGTFTESVTFVGNDKIWKNDANIVNSADSARASALSLSLTSQFLNDSPVTTVIPYISGTGYSITYTGAQQRQHLNFTPWSFAAPTGANQVDTNGMTADPFCTILPPDVDGISSSGVNNKSNGTDFDCHVQSINISVDLGRDSINELGRRGPYHRYVNFPVEVTCSIEAISTSGDMKSATENGILSTSTAACGLQANLSNRTIRLATCKREVFYLGTKNKLTSIELGGGGTDGGNETITYNYRNYNVLTVMALSDPHDNTSDPDGVTTTGWWNINAAGAASATGVSYVPGGYYLVN